MKKINLLLAALFALTITFSCSDVEETIVKNYLSVNGSETTLTQGTINQYAPNLSASPVYKQYYLTVSNSSIQPSTFINFYIYSSSTTSLSDGVYTFNYYDGANYFNGISVGNSIQYDSYGYQISGTYLSTYYLDETYTNKITVSSEGDDNIYEFDLKFIQSGTTYYVKGQYKGALTAGYGY